MSDPEGFIVVESKKNNSRQKSSRPKKDGARRGPRTTGFKPSSSLPSAIVNQLKLREKYDYNYRVRSNGNVENNSTLYLDTHVAHPHQVAELFQDAIQRAKEAPHIFGENFECDVQVNVVRKHTGEYTGHGFVDLSNPALYYVLIGCNPDGSERAEYFQSKPQPPREEDDLDNLGGIDTAGNWADEEVEEIIPMTRRELPPLLVLHKYQYDDQQREHVISTDNDSPCGSVSISPAFITPGIDEAYDECSLYVTGIPDQDIDFLYQIFARYARSSGRRNTNYPIITIRESKANSLYATVRYAHPYDAHFALLMLRKIRAHKDGQDVEMRVRHALATNHK